MVDFQNEGTVATAPKNLLNVIILENYYNLILSLEEYNKLEFQNAQGNIGKVRARLVSLITCQYNAFKREFCNNKESETYNKSNAEIWSLIVEMLDREKKKTPREVMDVLYIILTWLDDKNFIRVDDRFKRDYTDIYQENMINGFT